MKFRNLATTLLLTAATALTSGCAGVLVAGAATTASVVTDPRSAGTQFDDTTLGLSVDGKLSDIKKQLENARILSVVYNGNVLLVGQAKTQEQRALAEAAVRKVAGIKQVYNQVRLGHPIGFTTRSNDTWITTKLKAQLIDDDRIDSARISVTTENGEVFLLGIVHHAEGERATDAARKVSGVTQVIRLFEYLD